MVSCESFTTHALVNYSCRNSAVEFSFFVLADSGAFVTQAPQRFIPADVILR